MLFFDKIGLFLDSEEAQRRKSKRSSGERDEEKRKIGMNWYEMKNKNIMTRKRKGCDGRGGGGIVGE